MKRISVLSTVIVITFVLVVSFKPAEESQPAESDTFGRSVLRLVLAIWAVFGELAIADHMLTEQIWNLLPEQLLALWGLVKCLNLLLVLWALVSLRRFWRSRWLM